MAAHELSKAGHSVHIFEQSDGLGGLVRGFPMHGTSLERAYHHIFRTDRDVLSLIHDHGLGKKLVWNRNSTGIQCNGYLYPFNSALDLLCFDAIPLFDRLRVGIAMLYLQRTKRFERLISIPAQQWLRKFVGRRAFDIIWEPLLKGKFHNQAERISMAWLWARVHTRANSKGPGRAGEQLGYFCGGFKILLDALQQTLKARHVRFRLQSIVTSLVPSADGASVTVNVDGETCQFDHVLCTIPSPAFERLIPTDLPVPAGYRAQLHAVDYLGAMCVVFSSPQSLSPHYWINVHDRHCPFVVCVQHTNLVGCDAYTGKHIYYLGTYLPHDNPLFVKDDSGILSLFFKALLRMFPLFDRTLVMEEHVFRFRNAQHVVDTGYCAKIPSHQTPLRGVYLANFSQIFPEDRGINGAVREGRNVAHMIMQTS